MKRKHSSLVAACVVTVAMALGASAGASVARPHSSAGDLLVGGLSTTLMDPAQSGYSTSSNTVSGNLFGHLFLASKTGAIEAGLASGYSYNKNKTELTITLRHGAKYSDGSAVNASSIVWNIQRLSSQLANSAPPFALVSSETAKGLYTVIIHFSQPDAVLPSQLASSDSGYMGSPTAYNSLGAQQFGFVPVGAGPFQVQSVVPGQTLTLVKDPHYYDAKHVYLNEITFTNTGTDPTAQLDDLESGAIDIAGFSASTTPPTVIAQASADSNLQRQIGPDIGGILLPINTYAPPFNNQLAREAVAYCVDRQTIAQYDTAGFAFPSYTDAGTSVEYNANGWKVGESLNPYSYDPSKATALVNQLGGLSFQFQITPAVAPSIPVSLISEWTACGMTVKPVSISSTTYNANLAAGSYQIAINPEGSSVDPRVNVTYDTPSSGQDSHGFDDSTVLSLITQADGTTNQATLKTIWFKIWKRLSTLAVNIPVISAPTFEFESKCVKGLELLGGLEFAHVTLSC